MICKPSSTLDYLEALAQKKSMSLSILRISSFVPENLQDNEASYSLF